jgi:hypothetical protein
VINPLSSIALSSSAAMNRLFPPSICEAITKQVAGEAYVVDRCRRIPGDPISPAHVAVSAARVPKLAYDGAW